MPNQSTQPQLVFLDTETTGLDPARHEIWEIAAIVRHPAAQDLEYCWQIRPDLRTADPTALRIAGYYDRFDYAGRRIGEGAAIESPDGQYRTTDHEVAGHLATILDGAIVVGAVPWFDEQFLRRFLRKNGQAATNHYHLVDVETLAAGYLAATYWIGQRGGTFQVRGDRRHIATASQPPWDFDELLATFGLTYDEPDRHTALGDARMVRDLYDAVAGTVTKALAES
jgi:DNA polymerase III epsilon subunit-like protein